MDDATRLQYLAAMCIDVWVPRHMPIAVQTAFVDEVSKTSRSADVSSTKVQRLPVEDAFASQINHNDSQAYFDPVQTALANSGSVTDDWTDLQQEVSVCRACSLCETRTQTVFGVGSRHASWMLIGEAPGQNEDLQGEPFVGRAGQLLNEMLRALGLQREQVFIANILKCRPPNNRDPIIEEVEACHPFLQRQIALLQPKIILAVGRIAAQNLLKTQQPLAKLRGKLHRLENIPLVVVHHPAYLLRALTEKAKAWDDLQFALSVYQSLQEE